MFKNKKDLVLIIAYVIAISILIIKPTGFEKEIYYNSETVKTKVLDIDNSGVIAVGLYNQGDQKCLVKILNGSRKGDEVWGVNMLSGNLEVDKMFQKGDYALAVLERNNDGSIIQANLVDHYRIRGEAFLVFVFGVLLVIFSGTTGIRTILSFVLAIVTILKLLIPALLKEINPLLTSLFVGFLISVFTIFLVSGINRRSYSALFGTLSCSVITLIASKIFSYILKLDGSELPWIDSLLYAGKTGLDLPGILQGAVYLSSLGALLDLAIDISAALEELTVNKPDISNMSLITSGINIGRTTVGSQTTTLLLAYMGSYITIMMVYMVQGTPIFNILTSKAIASEILFTFVGCMGLVFIAPMTSFMFTIFRNREER